MKQGAYIRAFDRRGNAIKNIETSRVIPVYIAVDRDGLALAKQLSDKHGWGLDITKAGYYVNTLYTALPDTDRTYTPIVEQIYKEAFAAGRIKATNPIKSKMYDKEARRLRGILQSFAR